MERSRAVIIATEGVTTNLLWAALSQEVEVTRVFIEPHEPKSAIIKRRFKRLGIFKTLGQIAFLALVLPFIPSRKKRIQKIIDDSKLSNQQIDPEKIFTISSVHDSGLIQQVLTEKPDLIFINGTRILKNDFLDQMNCPILNIHVGITPKYRGVHGGYWAKRNDDNDLFGVTLHFVDSGIDTGHIIAQQTLKTKKEDNFKTYPILQYCAGIELVQNNLETILKGTVKPVKPLTNESKLHYHPTFFAYLFGKK